MIFRERRSGGRERERKRKRERERERERDGEGHIEWLPPVHALTGD